MRYAREIVNKSYVSMGRAGELNMERGWRRE